MDMTKEQNKKLIERYPFLLPHNRWTDKVPEDYDYITQIKEKFGSLRWYDHGCTEKMLREIIPKYENLSAYTCIRCGKPATRITLGWICPFCDDCVPRGKNGETTGYYESMPIEEYYKECTDELEN